MPQMRVKLAMMAKPTYYGVIRVVCPFCREELRTSDRALLRGTHCKNRACKAKIRYVPVAQRAEFSDKDDSLNSEGTENDGP